MITDVDGVLTDGGMFYSHEGDIMKKFHTRDGMGVNILRRNKIPTIIVTKEKTTIVRKWATKMNVHLVLDGVTKKEAVIPWKQILKLFQEKNSKQQIKDPSFQDKINFSIGYEHVIDVGSAVDTSTPLVTVHTSSKEDFEQVKENIQLCFEIKDDKIDKLATTYKRIN